MNATLFYDTSRNSTFYSRITTNEWKEGFSVGLTGKIHFLNSLPRLRWPGERTLRLDHQSVLVAHSMGGGCKMSLINSACDDPVRDGRRGVKWRTLPYAIAICGLRVIWSNVGGWEQSSSITNFPVPPMLICTICHCDHVTPFKLQFTRFLWCKVVQSLYKTLFWYHIT